MQTGGSVHILELFECVIINFASDLEVKAASLSIVCIGGSRLILRLEFFSSDGAVNDFLKVGESSSVFMRRIWISGSSSSL